MKKNKYTADLSINKFKIDKELLEQSQRYYDWALMAAEAEIAMNDAKDDYDIVLAEVENKIRKNPEEYLHKKQNPTEGAIKSAIANNKKIQKYYQAFREARNVFKLVSKAEKAFEQRKRMLEMYLYHIHRNMESEVKVPREYEKQFNHETRRSIEKQIKLKRR